MRLRGRFTLWFALAALVPIALAAVATREVISRNSRNNFERDRAAAEANLQRELGRLQDEIAEVVASMFASDDPHPLVHGVWLELTKGMSRATLRRIRDDSLNFKRGLGLDVLFIVGTGDEILAAPHYHPHHDTSDPVYRERAGSRRGQPYFVREPVFRDNQIASVLVVESAREYREGEHWVGAVGGRLVTAELLDSVRQQGRIDARIIDSEGRVLIPAREPEGAWTERSAETFSVPLPGPSGANTAMIEVVISRAELEQVLGEITAAALVLAAAALLVTILLGVLVARRMTSNLDRLVVGAQAASRGDLDHRVDIKGRDEIGAVAESFNDMMEELKTSKERLVIAERVAAWQEIARRLAHEIKNPLTPIQMSVETMRKTWRKKHPSFDEIFDESTETVLEETARLKRIVSEFSEFARLPKPSLEPCDLSEAVSSCLALYQGTVPLTRKLGEGLPSIIADRDQLSQIVLNLVENARHAVEERAAHAGDSDGDSAGGGDGRIVVETRIGARGNRLELVIEDNGPGLPEHVKDKLFTPYFTTKTGGTGL
ncbi:MAG: HAMP domain-containing protein, partial [Myxococcota bacterium]